MSAFILIIAAMLIGDVAWWLWADRKLRRTRHPKVWRPLLGLWCGLLLGYLVFFIVFREQGRQAHAWMPVWALAAIYIWHFLLVPVLTLLLAGAGIVRGVRSLARWWRRPKPAGVKELSEAMAMTAAPAPTRRHVLAAAAVAIPPLLTIGAVGTSLRQLHRFRVRRFELAFPTLPRSLDGITIAHVSDVHVGRFTRPRMLPAIADATNQLKADLILLTGDLIDLTLADLPAALDFVRRLDPQAGAGGLFMCEGNHDLIEDRDGFEIAVRKAGVPLLLDENKVTYPRGLRGDPIQLLGLTWRRGEAGIVGAMSNIVPQRDPDMFQILLAHHPHAFDPAAAVGIPLTLSGHTHGGQLMLNERMGIGRAMFRYVSGLYEKQAAGASKLMVSNGVGNWFPLRTNAPAEIVHLTLRAHQ